MIHPDEMARFEREAKRRFFARLCLVVAFFVGFIGMAVATHRGCLEQGGRDTEVSTWGVGGVRVTLVRCDK